ncbi:hypothetical protein HNP38_003371 [Chryseobacterium defluvii]|uniref:Uncharacterized protein n=1 Tax=Chryseobacterium defluvii TaxID=160396 RepID=A0A840KF80_9FLAO|nr:hypothetical protein [Chryseobacterium defluvii]MBB4808031.1 hypothetical protein [Chryseobacterium defluvii]
METQYNNMSPASFLKQANTIFFALLAGMVIVGGMMYMMEPGKSFDFDFRNPLLILMVTLMIAGIFASNFLYHSFRNRIELKDPLSVKITKIRQALIIRFALIEGPAMSGVIFYMMEYNLAFLMLSALIVFYFVTLKPSKDKLMDDMNLTSEEKREFEKI